MKYADVVMVPKLFHNSTLLWGLSQSKALGQVLGGVLGKVPVTFWKGSGGRSGKAAGSGSCGEVWGKLCGGWGAWGMLHKVFLEGAQGSARGPYSTRSGGCHLSLFSRFDIEICCHTVVTGGHGWYFLPLPTLDGKGLQITW